MLSFYIYVIIIANYMAYSCINVVLMAIKHCCFVWFIFQVKTSFTTKTNQFKEAFLCSVKRNNKVFSQQKQTRQKNCLVVYVLSLFQGF